MSALTCSFEAFTECLLSAKDVSKGKPVARNTRLVAVEWDGIDGVGVKLHNTIIVSALSNGDWIFHTDDWNTMVTAQRMHDFSPPEFNVRHQYQNIREKRSNDTIVNGVPIGKWPWLFASDGHTKGMVGRPFPEQAKAAQTSKVTPARAVRDIQAIEKKWRAA